MNRTADLDTALGFVIGRIEEEATRSGEPLSDEQRFLLNHLPTYSAWTQPYGGDPEIPAQPIPRDTTYELVCAAAKAAHHHRSAVESGDGSRLGICRCCLEAQPPSSVLALTVGGRETAQAVVGPLASRCCCAAVHILRRSCDAARGERTLDSIPMDSRRGWVHCYRGSSVFCFTTDRGAAVEAKH
jgi:hypothetical protein